MTEHRFDAIARALGGGQTRRHAVRRLGALAVAAPLALAAGSAAAGENRCERRCRKRCEDRDNPRRCRRRCRERRCDD